MYALKKDMFAKSSWKTIASLHRTIEKLLGCFGLTLIHFTIETVLSLSTALRKLKYRSAKNYLSTA